MVIRKEQAQKIDFNGLTIFDYTANRNESSSFAIIKVPQNIRFYFMSPAAVTLTT